MFGNLQQYVGNMKQNEAQRFLCFVTGGSVCLSTRITLTFNGLGQHDALWHTLATPASACQVHFIKCVTQW